MWTRFMDMHSGGSTKEPPYDYIYIEAPEAEAINIFGNRFGHDPRDVCCPTCGENYSTDESEELAQATGYDRGCDYDAKTGLWLETNSEQTWRKYMTLDEYFALPNVLIIRAEDILPEEYAEYDRWGYDDEYEPFGYDYDDYDAQYDDDPSPYDGTYSEE